MSSSSDDDRENPESCDEENGTTSNGRVGNEPPKEKEKEDDGESECGFCLFMKGGACKETFISWEKCVEDAEDKGLEIAEKCFEATALLKKCMDAHSDYYEPVLRAERAIKEGEDVLERVSPPESLTQPSP